jgi:hypothetical protein
MQDGNVRIENPTPNPSPQGGGASGQDIIR